MSTLILKKEIRHLLRCSGREVNSKMSCSIVKLLSMRYKNLDRKKLSTLTNEIICESLH
ncbi:hypothetical protein [Halarcobacter mediterraneus]|uniref:hypothetical protein n=1 Tax=Halarcobacter mediterraneus TaxID=2023153 RepID=UPI0013E9008D|nr:hypothetical protein [Halarcobacter mediterraneus]